MTPDAVRLGSQSTFGDRVLGVALISPMNFSSSTLTRRFTLPFEVRPESLFPIRSQCAACAKIPNHEVNKAPTPEGAGAL